jgi:hypothetical protein
MSPQTAHSISIGRRFIIAGLGGITPVLLSLIVIDLETLLINVTVIAIVSYLVRVIALFAIGGIVGWLHKKEVDLVKLFQLGIAAPALISAAMNGGRITLPKAPTDHAALSSWSIVSEAIAQPTPVGGLKRFTMPQETPTQQIRRGLFGAVQKNVWFVIAGTQPTREAAENQAADMRRRGFPADVYAPYDSSNPCYSVVIGAQLTQADAQQLQARAVASGLPKDTFLWTFPRK